MAAGKPQSSPEFGSELSRVVVMWWRDCTGAGPREKGESRGGKEGGGRVNKKTK